MGDKLLADYWVCDCEQGNIHSYREKECLVCNSLQEQSRLATLDEVEDYFENIDFRYRN